MTGRSLRVGTGSLRRCLGITGLAAVGVDGVEQNSAGDDGQKSTLAIRLTWWQHRFPLVSVQEAVGRYKR